MGSTILDQLNEAFQSMVSTLVAWTPRVVLGLVLVILALGVANGFHTDRSNEERKARKSS